MKLREYFDEDNNSITRFEYYNEKKAQCMSIISDEEKTTLTSNNFNIANVSLISFDIDQYDSMYFPFRKFLKKFNSPIVEISDSYRSENNKFVRIEQQENKISISFNPSKTPDDIDRFNITIYKYRKDPIEPTLIDLVNDLKTSLSNNKNKVIIKK